MPPAGSSSLALSVLAGNIASQTRKLDANCVDVVIFMARGNNAAYHDIRIFPFVLTTCEMLMAQGLGCDFIDIEYDVTLGGPYCDQIAEGAGNGIAQITAFAEKCPCTKIVVNGYSQGANVVGDILGGPGGCYDIGSTGIDPNSAAGKAIAAALVWGDVRHTAYQPYDILDGANRTSIWPRDGQDLANFNRYSPVLRSYCAAEDPYCANGDSMEDHWNYFELYTNDASSWIASMVNNVQAPCVNTISSVAPSANTMRGHLTADVAMTLLQDMASVFYLLPHLTLPTLRCVLLSLMVQVSLCTSLSMYMPRGQFEEGYR